MSTPPSLDHYKNHRFPAEIISYTVWLYFRFCLSFRDVAELLFERGVVVTHKAIRKWSGKFGQQYANHLRHRRPRPGDKWHLDEVFLTIKGDRHYLWRAVVQEDQGRDGLEQPRRDKPAAKKFFRKLLKGLMDVPRVLITDKLKSYGAAKREILPGVEHRQHRSLNNRAEVRLVGQKPNTPWCLGDWPWGPKRSGSRTPELDASVGAMPTVRGEGLNHRPHGSDWSSIREAGLNADKREATLTRLPGERDRGTRRKGKQLSVGWTSESRLTRWSHKVGEFVPYAWRPTSEQPWFWRTVGIGKKREPLKASLARFTVPGCHYLYPLIPLDSSIQFLHEVAKALDMQVEAQGGKAKPIDLNITLENA